VQNPILGGSISSAAWEGIYAGESSSWGVIALREEHGRGSIFRDDQGVPISKSWEEHGRGSIFRDDQGDPISKSWEEHGRGSIFRDDQGVPISKS